MHFPVILSLLLALATTAARAERAVVLGTPGDSAMSGMDVEHRFESIDACIVNASPAVLARLARQPGVRGVGLDRTGRAALARSVPQLRADRVQRRDDFGAGVTVAVIDDGVEQSHPDLLGRIAAEECFCAPHCCPDGTDRQSGPGAATPSTDHGTHVAGIIASAGQVAPLGVAPAARVVAIKVLDDQGRGLYSDWLRALDWIASQRPDVRVVNMSLESDLTFAGFCDQGDHPDLINVALGQLIGVLRTRGTLTFAASGNQNDPFELSAPGCVSSAIAVGGLRRDDVVASYSNGGAALDLLAPGGGPGLGGKIVSSGLHGGTAELDGTSMAAAHASGAAALVWSLAPGLAAAQVETILQNTGRALLDERNGLVRPRVDALAAYQSALDHTRPLSGRGSRYSDCLLEWNVTPDAAAQRRPHPGAVCRDNDPGCDADQVVGQCTFSVAACLLLSDTRLPRCSNTTTLTGLQVTTVSRSAASDNRNQAALDAVLTPLPRPGACSEAASLVVPTTATVWIRGVATAADGRRDSDRLRLRCIP